MRRLLAAVSLAFLIGNKAAGQQIRLQRFEQNPIIRPELQPGDQGKNMTKYEGSDLPLTVSKEGAARERLRELRDPAFFEENGKWYLLYSVAAESGIAIGELKK